MAGLLVYAKKINALRMIAYYYTFLRIISHYYVLLRKLLHGKNNYEVDTTKDQDDSRCFQRWVYQKDIHPVRSFALE